MSLSTYLTPSLTVPGVLDPQYKLRRAGVGVGNSITQPGTLCYLNFVLATSGSIATSGAINCPTISPNSTIFLTSPPNIAGTLSATIVPGVSFTVNSTSTSDNNVRFCYIVVG